MLACQLQYYCLAMQNKTLAIITGETKNVIFVLIIIHYLHTYQKNCDEHHELYVLNNKFAAIFIFPG
ncbi:hypothetical protein E2M12_06015 [Salmonella enterica subsp. enterica serovar Agona]|nr:hypothetical protein [Salmonella enterica subsp. enterica serovar Agona]